MFVEGALNCIEGYVTQLCDVPLSVVVKDLLMFV